MKTKKVRRKVIPFTDISEQKILSEIKNGERSLPFQELTEKEEEELRQIAAKYLSKYNDGAALLKADAKSFLSRCQMDYSLQKANIINNNKDSLDKSITGWKALIPSFMDIAPVISSREILDYLLQQELSVSEHTLIDFNIPVDGGYNAMLSKGLYQRAYDYIMCNRHLLVLEKTQERLKEEANTAIKEQETLAKGKLISAHKYPFIKTILIALYGALHNPSIRNILLSICSQDDVVHEKIESDLKVLYSEVDENIYRFTEMFFIYYTLNYMKESSTK